VWYGAGWHNIFSGTITKSTWVEKAIGSTESVLKARVTMTPGYNSQSNLYEFEFNQVVAPPVANTNTLQNIKFNNLKTE